MEQATNNIKNYNENNALTTANKLLAYC